MSAVKVIAAQSSSPVPDASVLRHIRGSWLQKSDTRFFLVAFFSLLVHGFILLVLGTAEIPEEETVVLEKIPERFAKLIIDKPIEKKPAAAPMQSTTPATESSKPETEQKQEQTAEEKKIRQVRAKKRVAARAARVEKKIRTVGVLGMLTGVGTTAKGAGVIDVLGSGNKKERFGDLDKALESISGLQKTDKTEILQRKLVKSKDIAVRNRESIDNLIAQVDIAHAGELTKKGNFVIQRPESIEGAASSNAKRDTEAINRIVRSHKRSIQMSYERYLRRDPSLKGKITVRFTIAASGHVVRVEIIDNTLKSEKLAREIIRKIRIWRFESIPEGEATVVYPFVFQPS